MKPNLRSCGKAGPSKTISSLKTSVQETVVPFVSNIHSNPEDCENQNHHEGPLTDSMPVSEDIKDEVPMMWENHLEMGMDTAVDLSVG